MVVRRRGNVATAHADQHPGVRSRGVVSWRLFMEMAERVYGDTGGSLIDREAATLARWMLGTRSAEVHVRHLQRKVRLPGLHTAAQIRGAADRLVALNWLYPPPPSSRFGPRTRLTYPVNPRLWGTKAVT